MGENGAGKSTLMKCLFGEKAFHHLLAADRKGRDHRCGGRPGHTEVSQKTIKAAINIKRKGGLSTAFSKAFFKPRWFKKGFFLKNFLAYFNNSYYY
jgi:ABC-type molybdenum transport system ATPase subunit/photorepair protein PhrA